MKPNGKNKTTTHEASLVLYKAKTLTPRSTSDGRKLTPCICNISMEEGMRIERLLASEEWNWMVKRDSQGYDDPNFINPQKSRTDTGNSGKNKALVPYKAMTLTQRIEAVVLIEGDSRTN